MNDDCSTQTHPPALNGGGGGMVTYDGGESGRESGLIEKIIIFEKSKCCSRKVKIDEQFSRLSG